MMMATAALAETCSWCW